MKFIFLLFGLLLVLSIAGFVVLGFAEINIPVEEITREIEISE